MTRSNRLLRWSAGALALGAAFAYGFAVARWKVFPYGQLAAAARGLRGEAEGERPKKERKGWWELRRQPQATEVEGLLEELGDLGYAQTYQAATGAETGVTVHDAARAQPGYNLIVSAHAPSALLTDMHGEILREWSFEHARIPRAPGDYRAPGALGEEYFRRARLLEDGSLLVVYDRTALIKLDRRSELAWGLHGDFHHDLDVTPDGTIWVLTREDKLLPRFNAEKPTVEDFVTRVSPDGRILGRTSLLGAFENSPYDSLLEKAEPGGDIFHTNTLTILGPGLEHLSPRFAPGRALISVWGLDTVALVDLEQGKVDWALSGLWHRQHEPVLLADGHLLVFDNMWNAGRSKVLESEPFSRVIEIEPFTQEVVWSYAGDERNDFYSALCGSCQRLENGNTLITESLSGRAFEVTPAGETVWRWESPYRVGPEGEGVAVLMEVIRLDADLPVAQWN